MSTLGELRAALELALDWYEPKHDDVVPRWVVLARVALVAEGQGAPGLREALELYLRTYADTQTHPTVIEEANCINVARAALASPAGRAEQAEEK